MQQQSQQSMPGDQITVRGSINFLYLAIAGHATCLTPFMRRDFGSEALGLNGVAAFAVIALAIATTESPGMAYFMYAWLAAMLLQRINSTILKAKGRVIHSRYDGYPWLGMNVPFVRAERTARAMEAFLCMVAGPMLMAYDETLGTFVFMGFFSLLFKQAIDMRMEEMAIQRMHDAEIEQRAMAERYRGSRNY